MVLFSSEISLLRFDWAGPSFIHAAEHLQVLLLLPWAAAEREI
ncbi:hypothetical protein MITS9509_01466 [Synechococcus sp. MIT S9509]|nr:hypothetical protein [Synechococcus sp. MIT S9504]KZR86585.1 hypothetical protein MITS9504_01186 [Synechococcus sp. MIT S9504]KZR92475.1 hypothetical protein MITS9509_01466 [Synechococcus sp. MIT S9509]